MLTSTGTYVARLAIGFVAALIASWSAPAMAQTTAQIPLQFDFLPPGARSVAMGSAFVGAADDATAAFTNPAGLARLSERSVSAELRFKRLTTTYLSAGRVSGNITGIGLDTIPMPVYGEDVDDHFGPTFGSLLWPFGANTSVIGYAHQVATIENAFSDQGVFFHFSAPGISDDHNRKNPVGGSRSVTITNYGGNFHLGSGGWTTFNDSSTADSATLVADVSARLWSARRFERSNALSSAIGSHGCRSTIDRRTPTRCIIGNIRVRRK